MKDTQEQIVAEDKLTQLEEFSQAIKEEYQKIDSEHTLELIFDKEHLDLILTVGFGIPYHKVSRIRTDGGTVKLILEKI